MTHQRFHRLEELVRHMRPVNLGNAGPAPSAITAISPEDAFLAWVVGLPLEAHIPSEADAALVALGTLKLRYPDAAVTRFEGYLREASRALPVVPGRRSGGTGKRSRH